MISSHEGHYIRAGNNRKAGERNSYEVWEDSLGKYVKMKVTNKESNDITIFTFDYDDLDKVLSKKKTWYLANGYVHMSSPDKYLHHLVTDFVSRGKGFQDESIDHIDRNPLNNRKSNLRRATAQEQQKNSKGQIDGTKRDRQCIAKDLPEGITQEMMPIYVSYYNEGDKEYFYIEDHPISQKKIKINGHEIKNLKSIQALWVNQHSNPKVPYPIVKKLEEIKTKCNALNELYAEWKANPNPEQNIVVEETDIIKSLYEKRKAQNTKCVYKFDENGNSVATYKSLVAAAKGNNVSVATIKRAIKDSNNDIAWYNHFYSFEEDNE